MKKVALIELGNSHSECLPSQIKFLNEASIHVTLICSIDLKPRVNELKGLQNILYLENGSWFRSPLFQLRNFLRMGNYEAVVFNTFHGKQIRKFFMLPLKPQNYVGIIHNVRKYKHSRTQKAINKKVQKYFTLAEYLISENQLELLPKVTFQYFYAINFDLKKRTSKEKKEGQIWIAIPGQLEYKRRDYTTLFDQIRQHGLQKHIHFFFLGKSRHAHGDGERVSKIIQELQIENQCSLWDHFVSEDEFDKILYQCDYLLPLIHSEQAELETYFKYQISGTFNIGFGYQIPMLLDKAFALFDDFKDGSIFYKKEELLQIINTLGEGKIAYKADPRFQFKKQQKQYLELLQKKGEP